MSAQPKSTVPAGHGCTAGFSAGGSRLQLRRGDGSQVMHRAPPAAEAVPGEHTLSSFSLCSLHGLPRSGI